jgi:hypothetical protein
MLSTDPPLASPEDMSIPRCVASGDEAIAALREHHDRWLRARAALGCPSTSTSTALQGLRRAGYRRGTLSVEEIDVYIRTHQDSASAASSRSERSASA